MAVKKKSDLELERDYFNAKKRVAKKNPTVKKTVAKKRAAPVRRKNPDLVSHAVKDKVHRHAILSVNHAGKALAGAGNPINKQGKLSYAQGYIEGAKDAGAITLSEANQLFDALRTHMKV